MEACKVLLVECNGARELTDELERILRSDPGQAFEVRRVAAKARDFEGRFRELASVCSPFGLDAAFFVFDTRSLPGMAAGLSAFHRTFPPVPVLAVLPLAEAKAASECLQHGINDCLMAPLRPDDVLLRLSRWVGAGPNALGGSIQARKDKLGLGSLIGESTALVALLDAIPRLAHSRANLLITGETGTGKGLIARAIHDASSRAGKPFAKVNCATVPEDLFESELFGHVEGAFTGAKGVSPGVLKAADGGTVLFDELEGLQAPNQIKLLTVLEDKEVRALGSQTVFALDLRFMAATNLDFEEAVRTRRLREDLAFRLNILRLHLVPLRERAGDVALLAFDFLRRFASEEGRTGMEFAAAALKKLNAYHWPGNVRQLQDVVHCAVVNAGHRLIGADSIEFRAAVTPPFKPLNVFLLECKHDYIQRLLASCGGNVDQAAAIAGIDPRHLRRLRA